MFRVVAADDVAAMRKARERKKSSVRRGATPEQRKRYIELTSYVIEQIAGYARKIGKREFADNEEAGRALHAITMDVIDWVQEYDFGVFSDELDRAEESSDA